MKHMQHPDKHTCNICLRKKWNIWNKRLQHKCTTIATYATSRSSFATSIRKPCNIRPKHLKHTLATCAFCAMSPCCLDECSPSLRSSTPVRSSMPQSTRRSSMRSSSVARTSPLTAASRWSAVATRGASPSGGGTRRGLAMPVESVPRATKRF
jgi:hypothetical protein